VAGLARPGEVVPLAGIPDEPGVDPLLAEEQVERLRVVYPDAVVVLGVENERRRVDGLDAGDG